MTPEARPASAGGDSGAERAAPDRPALRADAGVIAGTADAAPGTWRRFAAYMIQAFSAHNAESLPPPPTPTAMYRALLHLQAAGTRDQRCSSG
ncbi:MAG TPA: hypothetical protein VMV92_03200 [Streptosporangiaceae bacterium]|nr:hypothetical protein [Streptosporangiaceae bacterium]